MQADDELPHEQGPRRRVRLGRAGAGVLGAVVLGVGLSWLLVGQNTAEGRLERARNLTFDGRPEAALREVKRVLAAVGDAEGPSPVLREALSRAAQITDYHLSGRALDAVVYYGRLVEQFPGTPEAFDAGVRVAEIYAQRLGQTQKAERQFAAVVDAHRTQPGVERLLVRAARLAADGGRYEAAIDHAQRLLDEYTDSDLAPEAQSLVGTALHLAGRHADAVKAFQAVAERWPRTEAAARALFEAGNCLAEGADYAHAIARYLESLPDHPEPMLVQRSLERVRRHFAAERAIQFGRQAALGDSHYAVRR